jgi:hypothetical protein
MIKFIILALLIVGVLSIQTKTAADECTLEREAILLHNIKELEFTAGQFTASRRVAAIPQVCIPLHTTTASCSSFFRTSSLLLHLDGMHWWISTRV